MDNAQKQRTKIMEMKANTGALENEVTDEILK